MDDRYPRSHVFSCRRRNNLWTRRPRFRTCAAAPPEHARRSCDGPLPGTDLEAWATSWPQHTNMLSRYWRLWRTSSLVLTSVWCRHHMSNRFREYRLPETGRSLMFASATPHRHPRYPRLCDVYRPHFLTLPLTFDQTLTGSFMLCM